MFTLIRTAVRFFFIGFGVGILLAPRAGAETRQMIREKLNQFVSSVLEVADLPPVESPAGQGADTGGAAARGRARTGRRSESGADATKS